MRKILIIQGGGRPKGNTAQLVEAFAKGAGEAGHQIETVSLLKNEVKGCLGCNVASPLYFWTVSSRIKAFIERFYCIAEEDTNPPYGRYEKYPVKDCALLMTAADNFFWTFEQAVSYYQFALVNYIGFHDKGMLLAGGCGDTNGRPRIDETGHLEKAYQFGKEIYTG